MSTTPKIHNPDNLTPEQYGAAEGWRLLYIGEERPADTEYWHQCRWGKSRIAGAEVDKWDFTSLRTRTPDPYAPKAAADKAPDSGWIKMSERKPTEADYPIGYVTEKHYTREHGVLSGVIYNSVCTPPQDVLYWIKLPAPPSREPTQAEKDEAALVAHDKDTYPSSTGPAECQRKAWFAAIAYERAEIARLVADYRNSAELPGDLIKKIEARVKGTQ